jgi:hypothetical protein
MGWPKFVVWRYLGDSPALTWMFGPAGDASHNRTALPFCQRVNPSNPHVRIRLRDTLDWAGTCFESF